MLGLNLAELYEGMEHKPYVVTVTAGPYKRKKPAYQVEKFVRAKDCKSAVESARKLVVPKVRGAKFHAKLAHPSVLGMKPTALPQPASTQVTAGPVAAEQMNPRGVWCIRCKCDHSADIEDFTRSPSGVPLGRNEYQCPKCYRAWRLESVGEGFTTAEGFYVPPRRRCAAILPRT